MPPATQNGSSASSSGRLQLSDKFPSTRSFADSPELAAVRVSLDLVSAARRNIGFLRNVSESLWLHEPGCLAEAVRRYDELWMPLVSDLMINNVGSTVPMILPPFDVEWVWFSHCLNPENYRQYCEQRFSKLIGKPTILNSENEEYAVTRCKKLWLQKYPNEPFENESTTESQDSAVLTSHQDLLIKEVTKNREIYTKLSWPYMSEIVYLIAAKQRYKGFLFLLQSGFMDGCRSKFVPCLDILLMLITHQSYPTVYAEDLKEMERTHSMARVAGLWDKVEDKDVEETKNLWDKVFDQPYEKAGGAINGLVKQPPVYWEVSDSDVNTKYKSLMPRFLLEACVFVRLSSSSSHLNKTKDATTSHNFLRMTMMRCHKELRIDASGSSFPHDSWRKLGPSLYCEFATKGLVLELRRRGGMYFKTSKAVDTVTFPWNDMLRAPSLTLERYMGNELRVVASMTPPVQAPYLLKCVPDRVTDDSGAMISDVILRMNNYKPQEGRWLSRTVLDHAGRECFVVRMRVGGGFWRRGGETPSNVKWEDRIIEVREGSWSYVAGSIGRAPEKLVATATPKEPPEGWESAWHFSMGDELLIASGLSSSSSSIGGIRFRFSNQSSPDSSPSSSSSSSSSSVRLLIGRQMQYRASTSQDEEESLESGFLTLVRYSEDDPTGRATALLNWKLMIVESLPEEDAVLVLLLCIAILRSVSEIRKEDVGKLLIRRRVKEAKLGTRDWGSVMVDGRDGSVGSVHLQPWYWSDNAKAVVEGGEESSSSSVGRQPVLSYSLVEGGDKLYKRGIIS
ncbi:unnamed protein product [Linum tenue]|uniref:GRPD C-terminal domain-containing protein n=1 Tax=Linum tenue TaxID=586396 RepID=A0AAV0R3B1_9ROSI|nr:unnamed protein product [Linum tenue]